MKTVGILITNHNSGDTIALCIESIRKFTACPHNIIVYDDATDPAQYDDLIYLRDAYKNGRIWLIEGKKRIMHGKSIAYLLKVNQADLAMILDCDIEILNSGWLEKVISLQEMTEACMIADLEVLNNGNVNISSWFFMLDMKQYPHIEDEWCYTPREDGVCDIRPTGYQIWKNIVNQGRLIVKIPNSVKDCFYHHTHMSVLSLPKEGPNYEVWKERYSIIQRRLGLLRQE